MNLPIRFKLQQLVFPDGVVFDKGSNTLEPVKTNPIIRFLGDFTDSGNTRGNEQLMIKKDEKTLKVRTSDEVAKIDSFDAKQVDFKEDCGWKIREISCW
ncbi:MAG: hypothetical protein JKY22_07830 [Flavobacteriaceae bacterium]|nr:hypothetical protein [Flavobacteriaceae bacterium]